MRTCYCLLAILRFATAYKIITKSMIHSPDEFLYEPVPLKSKDDLTTSTVQTGFERLIGDDPTKMEHPVEEPPTVPTPDEEEEEYDESFIPTTTETVDTTTELSKESNRNRTKLYPVGRLWERTRNDIWSIISEAFSCIWSGVGLDCFTYKVVPMFKSLMGYQSFDQPLYILPREGEFEGRGRNGRRNSGLKLAKLTLIGLLGLKTLILPVLLGLVLISGKTLFVSLLSGILTAAAAWTTSKSADRRVQTDTPSQNYYM
ncbi:uncharacterized protein LOC112126537 [Cimex lectularius]|uniref:Uncharacterized protein n=1 Tax=Cimex lectularius TaxID=79782 RepID=A0A8I6TIT1_CIMLE|nr:uncharacterized protein LOC112126537 [Cimex lectularius]